MSPRAFPSVGRQFRPASAIRHVEDDNPGFLNGTFVQRTRGNMLRLCNRSDAYGGLCISKSLYMKDLGWVEGGPSLAVSRYLSTCARRTDPTAISIPAAPHTT